MKTGSNTWIKAVSRNSFSLEEEKRYTIESKNFAKRMNIYLNDQEELTELVLKNIICILRVIFQHF